MECQSQFSAKKKKKKKKIQINKLIKRLKMSSAEFFTQLSFLKLSTVITKKKCKRKQLSKIVFRQKLYNMYKD